METGDRNNNLESLEIGLYSNSKVTIMLGYWLNMSLLDKFVTYIVQAPRGMIFDNHRHREIRTEFRPTPVKCEETGRTAVLSVCILTNAGT
jgi:hypothetical protein